MGGMDGGGAAGSAPTRTGGSRKAPGAGPSGFRIPRAAGGAAVAGAVIAALLGWPLAAAAQAAQAAGPPQTTGGPVLLSELARTALERSRDIRNARYDVNVAGRQVSEAWAEAYPTLDLNSSYTRNVAPQVSFLPAQIFDPTAPEGEFIPIQFGADNIWNLSVAAEQPIFDARVIFGAGAAGRFVDLQEEALRGRSQQVVTRVRLAVYDLLLAQEEVRLTGSSLDRVRETLAETRARAGAGLATDYDVLRLEVELANLEPTLSRARRGRETARRTIALELDLDPETPVEVAGELVAMDVADPDANAAANRDILDFAGVDPFGDAADRALFGGDGARDGAQQAVAAFVRRSTEDRTDVRQLLETESLRRTEIRLEQVDYLPTVSAFGTYGLAAQQNGAPVFFGESRQRGSSRQVGLRVSVPVFSGFARRARVGQRRFALMQAEAQTSLVRSQADVELRNLVDEVREALQRTGGQRLAVDQARRGYAIASAQYREGVSSQLELMDAETALRQSEFNYAQAVYDYLAARARLDEAAGRVPLVDMEIGR